MLGPIRSRSMERIKHEWDLLRLMSRKAEEEKDQGLARKTFNEHLIAVKQEGEERESR